MFFPAYGQRTLLPENFPPLPYSPVLFKTIRFSVNIANKRHKVNS